MFEQRRKEQERCERQLLTDVSPANRQQLHEVPSAAARIRRIQLRKLIEARENQQLDCRFKLSDLDVQ